MKKRKILSFLLSISMIVSLFPQISFAANGDTAGKGERQVYLHAFENTPNVTESVNRTTVYMGDTANIYFAVDKPNKGDVLSKDNSIVQEAAERERIAAEQRADNLGLSGEEKQEYIEYEVAKAVELARHCEPQYDLQGYTVKIYFDTKYFKPASLDTKDAIDYKIPNEDKDFGIIDDGQAENEQVSVLPGYMTYKPEVHYQEPVQGDDESRIGWVSTTVFLMSNGFFPNKNENLWYNLCKLALIPKQTGHTSVRIDYDTSDDDTLELFAKNVDDEKLNFNADVKNDGIFYINIDDKNKPSPPRPDNDHPAGTYNEEINIGLVHDNTESCQIFYTTDGVTDPRIEGNANVKEFVNGDEIHLVSSTVIKTASKRVSDGKWSDVKSYSFNFRPKAPYLFNSSGKLIPNIYNEVWSEGGYSVIAFDTSDYSGGMTAGTKVYYTFNSEISPDYISDNPNGTDAENGWVGTLTGLIADKITRSCVMRLVTVNKWGASDVSVYYLGVKPDKVKASPGSGLDREQPITLSCQTPNAEIYYTLNGGDPRNGGELYTQPITLSTDTVIKAAALYNGNWSDVTSFWYLFAKTSGVTAFYPSGTYTGSVDVVLYPDEPGKTIKISYDNGITWTDYDGGTMHIDCYTEFRAKTSDDIGMGDEFVYIVKPYEPVFSPESAQFTSSDTVTVFNPPENGDGCELWYTTDGSEPTENDRADGDFVKIDITKYTIVKAVIVKDGKYKSDVVTNTYGVVYGKPAKPLTTLLPGFYTREKGSDEITTKFKQAGEGVDIYYTIGIGDDPGMTPDIHNVGNGTYKYIPGEDIEVIDSMTINAIAVKNINGELVQSDLATFYYLITPEAPKAAPSANVERLPVVPVDALTVNSDGTKRCVIKYTIGNDSEGYFSGEIENDDTDISNFYIDTRTGNAYKSADLSGEPLCRLDKSFNDVVILVLSCELDGVASEENAYIYSVDTENQPLIPPYADKTGGTYTESKDNFAVNLYSVYSESDNIKIQWKYEEDADWTDYSDSSKPEFKPVDKIIYIRTSDKSNPSKVSESVGYVYYFVPPAPVITPCSGVYKKADNTEILIKQPDDKPEDGNYRLFYSQSTDGQWGNTAGDFPYYRIDNSKTVKAYIKNMTTGRVSETAYAVYIAEEDNVLSGAVSIKSPFNKKRIGAHLLGKGDYAGGILFNPTENVIYHYKYTFTSDAGGGFYQSDNIRFEPKNALVPTEKMDTVTVNAWIDGEKQTTEINHTIDIIHLDIPKVNILGTADSGGRYAKGTKYNVGNIYPSDKNIIVYYTIDGSDPTKSAARKEFTLSDKGDDEILSKTTTVKTVYYSACGDESCEACRNGNIESCPNSVYGEIGTYVYIVPEIQYSGGGGGGGSSIIKPPTDDNNRKYTNDIFGSEHPTHIGYINGYPDGSVQPDGHITREEITAILYRITSHEYEKPFAATGSAFPDVDAGRWSVHDIEYMTNKDIVYGYPDGEFKPSNNLTRAEFAALICRFVKLDKTNNENPFPDLEKSHWAYDNILSLYESGLMDGYEDGTYRPEKEITRAEVMKTVNKILGRNPSGPYVKSLEFNPFNDLYKDKWYYVTVLEATVTHNYYLDDNGLEIKWEDCK